MTTARAEASLPAGDAALIRRVRRRLLLWSGGSTLVVLVVLGLLLYGVVANSLAAASLDQLETRAGAIGEIISRPFGGRPGFQTGIIATGPDQPGFIVTGPSSGTLAFVVTPGGDVFGPRALATELVSQADMDVARSGRRVVRTAELAGNPVRILAEPIERASGTWVVQVVGDRSSEARTLQVLLFVLAAGGVVALVASLIVGSMYADRALVPIRDALRRQREFAADASHELRTPLAIVRGNVELLRRHAAEPVATVGDALDDMEAETDRMTAMVDDLLLLARTDSGSVELQLAQTDLAEVALDACGGMSGQADEAGVRIEVDATPAPLVGDAARLRQLTTILVDNALRHSPAGSTVRVSVSVDGYVPSLVVEDEGGGIRPEDLPRVFDRFYRAADAPTGGTGLGLAIAAWIVDRHRGSIAATNRPPGGARFEVRLPAR